MRFLFVCLRDFKEATASDEWNFLESSRKVCVGGAGWSWGEKQILKGLMGLYSKRAGKFYQSGSSEKQMPRSN